ncbi:hypothetical protein FIU95_12250 [Microbulbifer sp. THAF38]|nr:hypothetical protein FIU95_12250 [Microbulbifer sp. THAF38]
MVRQVSDFATFCSCIHSLCVGGAKWRSLCHRIRKPAASNLKIVPVETILPKANLSGICLLQSVNPAVSEKLFHQMPIILLQLLCLAFISIRFFSSPPADFLKRALHLFSCSRRISVRQLIGVDEHTVEGWPRVRGSECYWAQILSQTCGRFLS